MMGKFTHLETFEVTYRDFRAGDVRHSLADVTKAEKLLGYNPTHRIGDGIKVALKWYVMNITNEEL